LPVSEDRVAVFLQGIFAPNVSRNNGLGQKTFTFVTDNRSSALLSEAVQHDFCVGQWYGNCETISATQ
jgi:hypothetical protein